MYWCSPCSPRGWSSNCRGSKGGTIRIETFNEFKFHKLTGPNYSDAHCNQNVQGREATKKCVERNITYTQFRSSLLQYRHCLLWLWNCIGWNSLLCLDNKKKSHAGTKQQSNLVQKLSAEGDRSKANMLHSPKKYVKEKNRSRETFNIPAFSPAISTSEFPAQALATWMKPVYYGCKGFFFSFSFMTNQEFPCDHIRGKISHKLQVLLPAKVSIFTAVMLSGLLSQDVDGDLDGLK